MKAVGAALALALGLTVVGGVLDRGNYNEEVQQVTQQQAENEMWQVIAGETRPSGINAVDRFAIDMKSWVDEGNAPEDFVGRNQQYVGLSNVVGYEVFEPATGCNDCGKLSAESLLNLGEIIESGTANGVVEIMDVDVEKPAFFDFGDMATLVAAWQIGGAAGLAMGLWKYQNPDMIWKRKDGKADTEETVSYILAPVAHAIAYPWMKKRREQIEAQENDFLAFNGLDYERQQIVDELERLSGLRNPSVEMLTVIEELESALTTIDELPSKVRQASVTVDTSDALQAAQRAKDKAHARLETAREMGV